MRKRVCNGQVHKVRTDGTKIKCDNGDFKAIKGRKGKAPEDEVNDSKNCDGQGGLPAAFSFERNISDSLTW